jgi:hypothetical protein
MAINLFENDEKKYQIWIKENLNGFVLTTTKHINIDYMSLHRSTCRTISHYMKNMDKNAFTGRGYIKICSNDPQELMSWIKNKGGKGFTKLCTFCNPNVQTNNIYKTIDELYDELEQAVNISIRDKKGRKERLKIASKKPLLINIITQIYQRNPDVIAERLEIAKGICKKCHQKAPFMKASDGSPYLEVHHIKLLSAGGPDSVENTIALCPNCHREIHFG